MAPAIAPNYLATPEDQAVAVRALRLTRRIVTESRRASISGIQRRLKIGYNRAARMVEQMEAEGMVGPLESNGNRQVLLPPPPQIVPVSGPPSESLL